MIKFLKRNWRKNIGPLLIATSFALVSVIIGIYPLIIKPTSVFISMDPDPMYVGNALQLLETGHVSFLDHPGTPLIILMSSLYFVFKIYAKLILRAPNFAVWFLQNITFIYISTRFLLVLVYFLGLVLFHLFLYKRFRSILVNIFFGAFLFLDDFHYAMYGAITPEILAFTLTSLWLWFSWFFEQSKDKRYIFVAAFVSGIISATKLSFMFVAFSTLLLASLNIAEEKKTARERFSYLFFILVSIVSGFAMGVFPLLDKPINLINRLYVLVFHTGISGGGNFGVYDLTQFFISLKNWFNQPFLPVSFLVLAAASLKEFYKKEKLLVSMLACSVVGIFVFMKYPIMHYETANILLLILAMSFIYAKLPNYIKFLIALLVLVFFNTNINISYISKRELVDGVTSLQTFLDEKNFQGNVVWEYGRSKDYSVIRSLGWSSSFFSVEFGKVYPHLMQLNFPDETEIINLSNGQKYPIDSTCWEALIIQSESWDSFIKFQKYPGMFVQEEIPGTDMLSVTYKDQLNCKTKLD